MQQVQNLLNNPVFKLTLKAIAPEIAIGLDLIVKTIGDIMGSYDPLDALLSVIDERLAEVLQELSSTRSEFHRRNLEVRAHELLGILNEWEQVT